MLERIKDIQFSSHSKRTSALHATTQNLSHAINFLGKKLPPEVKKETKIREILKLGLAHRLDLVHVIYHSPKGTELNSKDYNFSAETAHLHWEQGYENTMKLIQEKAHEWEKTHREGTTVYTVDGGKPLAINI
ncbi:DUF3734 domain-containing protein [Aquella oligotrophica]